MKHLKFVSVMAVLIGLFSSLVWAAGNNFFVNSVSKGQYTDLNVVNACGQTARTGMKGILDVACAKQASTSATTGAQTLIQASTADGAAVAAFTGLPAAVDLTCTQDTSGLSTCADYTTTSSTKVGSVALKINGTIVFLRTYNGPQ